jgi:hypothetical protein
MVPIIAFRHYAIRDFPPNCAELIRGLPAASPPSLLLASVSTRGGGAGFPLWPANSTGPNIGKFFYRVGKLLVRSRMLQVTNYRKESGIFQTRHWPSF